MTLNRFFRFMCFVKLGFLLLFFFSVHSAELPPEKQSKETLSLQNQDMVTFFSYVTDRLRREYVEPVTNDKLLNGALNGMLSGLDPHSMYLDAKHFEEVRKQTQGKYGGLGLEIMLENSLVRVISAIPDTPAAKAGIQAGDYIVMINDEPILGLSLLEAAEKLRGKPHTTVKLTLQRNKIDQFERVIAREDINIKPVDWKIEKEIGYIRLKTFNKETTAALHKSIQEIKAKLGRNLKGFIMDLRNNPGGLLDQAVSVSDTFLNQGEIVSIRGRGTQKITRFKATGGDVTNGLPLVILINGGSASASEIVAGALQDHHRAVILGTKSFGKGSVQTVLPLTNGGAIKFTTALYYTPAGRAIQKQGIIPDVMVEQMLDLQTVNEEKRFRESNFSTALDTERSKRPEGLPLELSPKERFSLPKERKNDLNKENKASSLLESKKDTLLKPVKDYQLEQALNVIRVMAFLGKDSPMLKFREKLSGKESSDAFRQ